MTLNELRALLEDLPGEAEVSLAVNGMIAEGEPVTVTYEPKYNEVLLEVEP